MAERAESATTERGAAAPARVDARRTRRVDWILGALLVIASMLVGIVQVSEHKSVSPVDEYVYIDYLAKVPSEGIVRGGERTGDYARETLACRGVRLLGTYPPQLCRTADTAPDSSFPTGGTNSADIYTPFYFVITWVLAQPFHWVGVSDLTNAGRLTGWIWLAAAAVLLYLSLRRLRVGPLLSFGLGLLMVGSLPAIWFNTYISTDAPTMLAGAAMLWGLLRFEDGARFRTLALTVLATVVTLFKLQNYGAVGVVAVVLLLRAAWQAFSVRGEPFGARLRSWITDRRVLAAALMAVVPMVFEVLWLALRNAIRVGESVDQGISAPFGWKAFISEMFKLFTGPAEGARDPSALGPIGFILATVLSWVIVSGVLGAAVVERRGSVGESIAVSTFGIALLLGPVLAILTIAMAGYYFALPVRYGLSLLPFYLACAGMLYRRKPWVGNVVAVVGIGCFGLSFLLPAG